ncbi:MAG: hypothetical protein GY761_19015 [Hyphomicrobiales bacterium]|nr:hypothetical protein [Hyphomicrobiales bacterium]
MKELDLPPLLNAISAQKPFDAAVSQVRHRMAGAGDLFWSHNQNNVDIAIVLEPEVSSIRALEMVPLAMVALSDCLAVLLPPQVAVQFRDSRSIVVNGGIVGELTTAMAKTNSENDIPDWLVLSLTTGLNRAESDDEPGFNPDFTTLDEEGWEMVSQNEFTETFARHFLSWLAAWNDDGFCTIARAWKFKAEEQLEPDMRKIGERVLIFESM